MNCLFCYNVSLSEIKKLFPGIFVSQVRMKAVCLLESILRRKDDEHFSIVYSYFSENKDSVVRCSESPQNSLREKAIKVNFFLKF